MQATNPSNTRTARRPAKTPPATLPAYNLADGVCSFRHSLTVRERSVMDRALDIVGWRLVEGDAFESPAAVKAYLQLLLGGETSEQFFVLYLNASHRAIASERHFSGTLTQATVYPREIVKAALHHHAAAVVLAHNHPSGSVQPSRADEVLTQSIKAALALVEVRVLDHIIVGGNKALSMLEMGLI